jgi:hypothetical protein
MALTTDQKTQLRQLIAALPQMGQLATVLADISVMSDDAVIALLAAYATFVTADLAVQTAVQTRATAFQAMIALL